MKVVVKMPVELTNCCGSKDYYKPISDQKNWVCSECGKESTLEPYFSLTEIEIAEETTLHRMCGLSMEQHQECINRLYRTTEYLKKEYERQKDENKNNT